MPKASPSRKTRTRVYTPQVTLWAWLSQAVHKGEHRSCPAAVARVVVLLIGLGRRPCSDNSGTYCKARAKLPEPVLRRLVYDVADGCEHAVPEEWLWYGRHVKLVDGTTVSMPDTPENQAAYPQTSSQEEGLGFPMARLVVLISLATAMITGMAIGPCSGKETGEMALFRELFDRLEQGDIVLGDRYFCSYFMICLLAGIGRGFGDAAAPTPHGRLPPRNAAGSRRSRRRVAAAGAPGVDGRGDVRADAGTLRIREMEFKVNQEGFPRRCARDRDHVARRRRVHAQRPRRSLSSTLVGGVGHSRHQVQVGYGRACVASRRRWFARRSGRACWRTT